MSAFDKPTRLMSRDECYAEARDIVGFFLQLGFNRNDIISIVNNNSDRGTDHTAFIDTILKQKLN